MTPLIILGGLLYAGSTIPYIIDIIKQRTRPRIVSWLNWCILAIIATFAAAAEHQYASAALTIGTALGTGSVVILGLKHGDRKFDRVDIFCQIGAMTGLLLWAIFNDPVVALLATVVIDSIAALPTLRHAWFKPHEETLLTYILGSFGAFCSLLAVSDRSLAGLLYPIYLCFANVLLAAEVTLSPHQKAKRGVNQNVFQRVIISISRAHHALRFYPLRQRYCKRQGKAGPGSTANVCAAVDY